jgi:hypothetical protein
MAKNQPITIGETEIKPGEPVNLNLPVADLYTSTELNMPLQIVCGRRSGLLSNSCNLAQTHPFRQSATFYPQMK